MSSETEDIVSPLGTHKYWNDFYDRDLSVFHETGDEGEIWFGKKIQNKMIHWIEKNISKESLIVDIGCGNGKFLMELEGYGYRALLGLDYSESGVSFSKIAILTNNPSSAINILQEDFLNLSSAFIERYSDNTVLVTDKGTFDAITLNPDIESYITNIDPSMKRCDDMNATRINLLTGLYRNSVEKILRTCQKSRPRAYFMITSCNWTKSELIERFEGWKYHEDIEHPFLLYGGRNGQVVTTIIFEF